VNGLVPLLKKEIREQWRTYRLVIVGGIFLIFGITTPLTLKYLPEILESTGEGFVIEMPPPTAAQSLVEYAGTIGQVGVLVAVLVAMGCIASELRHGTAVMILSKPVSRGAFVGAKLIAMSLTFLISLILASLFCFAYTVWLIEDASVMAFVGLNLLVGLFLVFCLAVTLLLSSLFKSSLAAGGIAMAVLLGQALLGAVPVIGDFMPNKILGWGNGLLTGGGDDYWWALAVTVVAIGFCVFLAQRSLKQRDL
jgi:ABC-2 type transport system permease protein